MLKTLEHPAITKVHITPSLSLEEASKVGTLLTKETNEGTKKFLVVESYLHQMPIPTPDGSSELEDAGYTRVITTSWLGGEGSYVLRLFDNSFYKDGFWQGSGSDARINENSPGPTFSITSVKRSAYDWARVFFEHPQEFSE